MAILTPKTFTSGDVLTAADVNAYLRGGYMGSVYFTSSGTFTKATYPWLRAIRVKVQGAGGGSGGCATTGAGEASGGGGGGGGGYAEKFITDIAGVSASETVTVGSGGAGGAAGNNAGSTGGTSSAFSLSATGGAGGSGGPAATFDTVVINPGLAGAGSGGDLNIDGDDGPAGFATAINRAFPSGGGRSVLAGNQARGVVGSTASGSAGNDFGGGAQGSACAQNQTQQAGAAGGNGIVIVELYA
jgi:hypothetical protein